MSQDNDSQYHTISEDQLAKDLISLGLAADWKELGIYLGIGSEDNNEIETNNSGRPNIVSHCFNNVIHAWLGGDSKFVNTETLAEAVKVAGYERLATKIRGDPKMTLNEMTVCRLLKPVRSSFRVLGNQLRVRSSSMDEFQAYKGNVKDCLLAVIELWYKKTPTKERLMEALDTMGKIYLKEMLTEKYKDKQFPSEDFDKTGPIC